MTSITASTIQKMKKRIDAASAWSGKAEAKAL